MCLAVPGKILEIEPPYASVDIGGIKRKVHLGIIDDPKIGEFVLVHAGFAISKIDRKEARRTIADIEKIREAARG